MKMYKSEHTSWRQHCLFQSTSKMFITFFMMSLKKTHVCLLFNKCTTFMLCYSVYVIYYVLYSSWVLVLMLIRLNGYHILFAASWQNSERIRIHYVIAQFAHCIFQWSWDTISNWSTKLIKLQATWTLLCTLAFLFLSCTSISNCHVASVSA